MIDPQKGVKWSGENNGDKVLQDIRASEMLLPVILGLILWIQGVWIHVADGNTI